MAMNAWRLIADLFHLVAMCLLLGGTWQKRSARTVSLRTQELYMVVYSTRYLDLFTHVVSIYNTLMKITFLALTLATILTIRFKFADTWASGHDSWRWLLAIPVALVLGMIHNYAFTFMEICWSLSIFLEAVAALPQLVLIRAVKEAQNFVVVFMGLMGLYRFLYLVNWGQRYIVDAHFDYISVMGGVSQVIIFFSGVVYVLYRRHGRLETAYNSDTGTIEFKEYQGVSLDADGAFSDDEEEDEDEDETVLDVGDGQVLPTDNGGTPARSEPAVV